MVSSHVITLTIKLTPKAARNAIIGWEAGADGQPLLKCSVTAVPENGKANAALIKMLAKFCGCAKSDITLIKGDTSRLKTVQLLDKNNVFSKKPSLY